MAAKTENTALRQPENKSLKLWRYMDFSKFVHLISSSQLYLNRIDKFEDPFEGRYSSLNAKLRPALYSSDAPQDFDVQKLNDALESLALRGRQWTYVNCWHANEHESAAMWNLYAKTNEAIAIETTYDCLARVLPEDSFLGCVDYLDYEKDFMPERNALHPFIHKRKSFEHEKEVRVIIQEADKINLQSSEVNPKHGISIDIDVNQLIRRIHVSPTAPDWLVSLTSEIASKYDLRAPVNKSNLYTDPLM